ncbi:hypothetical protein [Nocardioides terrigena]|nr:hypothetical protein [Nocardioides terrigena]
MPDASAPCAFGLAEQQRKDAHATTTVKINRWKDNEMRALVKKVMS